MLSGLRKAARSLESSFSTAFSSPSSTNAYVGTTLKIGGITVKLGRVFADGGFSYIHVASPVSSESSQKYVRYAVKRLPYVDADERRIVDDEIAALEIIPPHMNIVRYYGSCFKVSAAFLMFELADGGSLHEIITNNPPQTPPECLSIFVDIAAAIAHLHAQPEPIALRDVKLENVLYDRLKKCYKICDFGSCTTKTITPTSRAQILRVEEDIANNCTAMYRAPELVDLYQKKFICERTDVWALGCVWYAILFAKLPFDGDSSLQISRGLTDIPTHPSYPQSYIELLKGMLTVDPAERFDSFAVLETALSIQNCAMPAEMVHAAARLREIRKQQFGSQQQDYAPLVATANTSAPSILFNLDDTPASQGSHSPVNAPTPLISFNQPTMPANPRTAISAATSLPVMPATPAAPVDDDDEWADFQSAPTSTQPSRKPGFIAQMGASLSSQQSTLNSVGSRKVAGTGPEPDELISFGELGMTSPSKASSSQNAKSTGDLIDFG